MSKMSKKRLNILPLAGCLHIADNDINEQLKNKDNEKQNTND